MTTIVRCHHGHKFEPPPNSERAVVCPLCGAVTRFERSIDTHGPGAFANTLNMPGSGVAETGRRILETAALDDVLPTMDQESPNDTSDGVVQTVEFDESADGDNETTSAQTVAIDKTLDLGDTPTEATDAGIGTPGTVSLDKTVEMEGPVREDDLDGAPKTQVVDKAVVLDQSTNIQSARDPKNISATVDAVNVPIAAGVKAPQDLLPATMDFESPPSAPEEAAQAPPSPTKTHKERGELTPPDLPGYQVVGELGRGGMGVVYRAKQEKRNREVALKTLLHISPVELQRFKQEFRSLADIAHPNLAGLYDLLSDGETWCFSMEILEAVDFIEYVWSGFDAFGRRQTQNLVGRPVEDESRLSPEIKERLYDGVKQLALGLNTLHQAGMLHRDIKPSNVLVTTEGRVVLVDFGLASQFEEGSDERPTGIHGTPEYMAPEQAACNPISPASDWYAVGVMIYEVLTGYWPIQGRRLQIIFDKQTKTPRPPRELNPEVPDDLNNLCVALLDRDQDKRPTAIDVLQCIGADQELIDSLQTTTRVGSGQTLELVGREGHLQDLHASFRQVTTGMTKTIFVHGKSGMGKSVLIQKFLGDIRTGDEAVVLTGRCYEQESVPFKALDSLIDSLSDHLTGLPETEARAATPSDLLPLIRLFPVLGQIPGALDVGRPSIENVDQQELRQRAMNALREMLKRIGEHKPLVLYIDDLQWGDEDSANLLADLVRPPHAPRLLVLGSYRTENRDTSLCLKALDKAYTTGQHHPHREDIAVDSLQFADAKRLALMLLERDDDESQDLAGKIARESGGWPFFVWELAQHVQDSPEIADQSLELDEVIWIRVNRLPEETRRLLELVAITGRPIPAAEAYQAIDALEKGQGFLAQLRTRNLIRTTESEDEETIVESYHDRIRESVVDHLDDAAIKRHSLKLATTFENVSGLNVSDLRRHIDQTPEFDEPTEPYNLPRHQWQRVFDLAHFFDAAGEHERAFPFALVAAEQARKQDAQEVAEQQFRIALRGVAKDSPGLRFRVLEGLGDVLVLRGRYDDANEQFQAARSLANGNQLLARIDGKLGASARKKGDMGDAVGYLESALEALGESIPRNSAAILFGVSKQVLIQVLHTILPSRFVARRSKDTPQAVTDLFRARLYDDLTFTYWFARGMEQCLWSHLRQMNLAERYPPSQELGRTYAFHAITMTAIPLARRGISYAERAYEISRQQGNLWGQGQARSFQTFACIVLAKFKEGVERGAEAVRLLEEAGDVWEANMARMIATVPMYHLGDLQSAQREAKKSYEIGVESGDYSAVCISLAFWVPAAPDTIPPGAILAELERKREDPLSIAAAVYARGLELLFCEDDPDAAADVFRECLDSCKQRGLRNVCIFSAYSWRATACRIAAERAANGPNFRAALVEADRAVRAALKITKSYRAYRPHAFREAGLVAVLNGKERKARNLFERSLELAVQFEARYDHAKTLLAYGEAGLRLGWPGAEEQIAEARLTIAELEDITDG